MKKFTIIVLGLTFIFTSKISFAEEVLSKEYLVNKYSSEIIDLLETVSGLGIYDLNISQELKEELYLVKKINNFSFDINVSEVEKSDKKYILNLKTDVNYPEVFKFWKLKVVCDSDLKINEVGDKNNACGTIVESKNFNSEGGRMVFENTGDRSALAKIKFRAYDINNKWLRTNSINIIIPSTK